MAMRVVVQRLVVMRMCRLLLSQLDRDVVSRHIRCIKAAQWPFTKLSFLDQDAQLLVCVKQPVLIARGSQIAFCDVKKFRPSGILSGASSLRSVM